MNHHKHIKFTDKDLKTIKQMYTKQNVTIRDIASNYGCSSPTISSRLKSMGVQVIPSRDATKHNFKNEDIDNILKFHIDDKLSCTAIGNIYNCDHKTIQNILLNNNVQPITYRNMKAKLNKDDTLNIIKLYNKGYSQKEISLKYNTSKKNISKILKENNIDVKYYDKINFSDNDIKQIIKMYTVDYLTVNYIANLYKCSCGPIRKILKDNNIEIMNVEKRSNLPIKYYEVDGCRCNVIYMYTNLINNKKYIGMTNDAKQRHKSHYFKSKYGNEALYCAIRKYGMDNFKYEILEDNLTRREANTKEIQYIEHYDSYNNGYNSTRGGEMYDYTIIDSDKQRLIINDYTVNLLTIKELSKKYKYGERLISRILDHNKVKKHNIHVHKIAIENMSSESKSKIIKYYNENYNLSNLKIAQHFNLSVTSLNYLISDEMKCNKQHYILNERESRDSTIIELYNSDKDLTITSISKMLNLNRSTVSKTIKKHSSECSF